MGSLSNLGKKRIAVSGIHNPAEHFSQTQVVAGRNTAGAGVREEVTLSQLLDWAGSAARGDILRREASDWNNLALGNRAKVLGTDGTDVDWIGGAVLLATATASDDATVDFTLTGWTNSDFAAYLVTLSHVTPATDGVDFYMRTSTDGGSNYDGGASDYLWSTLHYGTSGTFSSTAGLTALYLSQNAGSDTNEDICGIVRVHNPSVAKVGSVTWHLRERASDGFDYQFLGGGFRNSAADIDAIRFLFSSGNIESGIFKLYGLAA